VLCPGPIATGIAGAASERKISSQISDEANDQLLGFLSAGIAGGMSPADCAGIIFQAIRNEQFWIFTHEDFKPNFQQRVDKLMSNSNPEYELLVTKQ